MSTIYREDMIVAPPGWTIKRLLQRTPDSGMIQFVCTSAETKHSFTVEVIAYLNGKELLLMPPTFKGLTLTFITGGYQGFVPSQTTLATITSAIISSIPTLRERSALLKESA